MKKEQLHKEWRSFVKKHHPDVGGDPEFFRKAKEEYELALVRLEKKESDQNTAKATVHQQKTNYNNHSQTETIFVNEVSPPLYWLLYFSLTILAVVLIWGFFIKPAFATPQTTEIQREIPKEDYQEDWYLIKKTTNVYMEKQFLFTKNPTKRNLEDLFAVPASNFPEYYYNFYAEEQWYTLSIIGVPINSLDRETGDINPYGYFGRSSGKIVVNIIPIWRNSL